MTGSTPPTKPGRHEAASVRSRNRATDILMDDAPDYVLIGKRRYRFSSFAEASRAYTDTIEATGATVSGRTGPAAPDCVFMKRIYGEDYCVGYVSYNGNVWSFEPHDLADTARHNLVWSPVSAPCQ